MESVIKALLESGMDLERAAVHLRAIAMSDSAARPHVVPILRQIGGTVYASSMALLDAFSIAPVIAREVITETLPMDRSIDRPDLCDFAERGGCEGPTAVRVCREECGFQSTRCDAHGGEGRVKTIEATHFSSARQHRTSTPKTSRRRRPAHSFDPQLDALSRKLVRRFEVEHELEEVKKLGYAKATRAARAHRGATNPWTLIAGLVERDLSAYLTDKYGDSPGKSDHPARVRSLDAPAFRGERTSRHEMIGASSPNPEERHQAKMIAKLIVEVLDEKEQRVFGCVEMDEKSIEEVAVDCGLTAADVRATLAIAKSKLKRALRD